MLQFKYEWAKPFSFKWLLLVLIGCGGSLPGLPQSHLLGAPIPLDESSLPIGADISMGLPKGSELRTKLEISFREQPSPSAKVIRILAQGSSALVVGDEFPQGG